MLGRYYLGYNNCIGKQISQISLKTCNLVFSCIRFNLNLACFMFQTLQWGPNGELTFAFSKTVSSGLSIIHFFFFNFSSIFVSVCFSLHSHPPLGILIFSPKIVDMAHFSSYRFLAYLAEFRTK